MTTTYHHGVRFLEQHFDALPPAGRGMILFSVTEDTVVLAPPTFMWDPYEAAGHAVQVATTLPEPVHAVGLVAPAMIHNLTDDTSQHASVVYVYATDDDNTTFIRWDDTDQWVNIGPCLEGETYQALVQAFARIIARYQ